MTDSYAEYLARKKPRMPDAGFDPPAPRPAAGLRDYQQLVVDRMLRQGRGCVFADCGAGKTRIELEWARAVAEHTDRPVLILTPLAVGRQMRAEAAVMGMFGRDWEFLEIANYQRLHHFDPRDFAGIVLDESSILKDLTGATRQALTEWVAEVPFRLAATATPAPNDLIELLSHAEWLGIMPWRTSAAMWMINDGKDIVEGWRLKGHAAADFWRWVRTWASIFRRPSDLGCPDPTGYDPPDYRTVEHFFDGALIGEADRLFAHGGLSELRRTRKLSMPETVRRIAELVVIDKNPQIKAVRTKDMGLLFATLRRDAANMHVAAADILLHFRAPGDNPEPVRPEVTEAEWIRWARPIWPAIDQVDDGIRETDTLNSTVGREASDERHICPLQLGLIRRAVRLWSNRGDLVYSPFAGIGSEGVVAVSLGRRFVGGELKPSYFTAAVEHVRAAAAQGRLW